MMAGYVVVAGLAAESVRAAGGVIVRADSSTPLQCKSITWNEANRQYVVETAEGASVTLPKANVARMRVDKPEAFDNAAQQVEARQYAQAVPTLERIASDYRMLLWDVQAKKLLLRCYLGDNNAAKVTMMVEDMLKTTPRSEMPAELMLSYWKGLRAVNREDTLKKEIEGAIASGSAEMAAAAYLMRGDASRASGRKSDALTDYLKVVLLLQQVKSVRPEALFKAAELLDELKKDDPRAEDLRKQLREEFKDSEFAAKLPPPK